MGLYEREYHRERRPKRPPLPTVTKFLLIANLVFFAVEFFSREGSGAHVEASGLLNGAFGFSVEKGLLHGQIWRLITCQFMHGGLLHVILNCAGIYFIGPHIERWMGSRRFTAYYLICGVGGVLFFTLLLLAGLLPGLSLDTLLVGASAGLFGLLYALYRISPTARMRLLFPPVTLTMRTLMLIAAGFALLVIIGGMIFPENGFFWNSGGQAAHLGGLLMGLLLFKYPSLIGWADGRKTTIVRPKEFRRRKVRQVQKPKLRPRTEVDLDESSEIDRILEKISEKGIDSLTKKERDTLAKARKR